MRKVTVIFMDNDTVDFDNSTEPMYDDICVEFTSNSRNVTIPLKNIAYWYEEVSE